MMTLSLPSNHQIGCVHVAWQSAEQWRLEQTNEEEEGISFSCLLFSQKISVGCNEASNIASSMLTPFFHTKYPWVGISWGKSIKRKMKANEMLVSSHHFR